MIPVAAYYYPTAGAWTYAGASIANLGDLSELFTTSTELMSIRPVLGVEGIVAFDYLGLSEVYESAWV